MRKYGVTPTSFWFDKGTNIRGNGNAMSMCWYLMTSPHSNMIGIYHLPMDYIKIDTRLTEEVIRETLHILREANFAFYDEGANTVWIPSYAAVQVAPTLKPGDTRVRAIKRELDKTDHFEFKKQFLERYGEIYHLNPLPAPPEDSRGGSMPHGWGINGASMGHQSPIEGASMGHREVSYPQKTVDNYGASMGHRCPIDTVPDTDPDGVKRGPGREGGRPRVTKMDEYLMNWPAEMAKKTRH
jgi:hypothetical protein